MSDHVTPVYAAFWLLKAHPSWLLLEPERRRRARTEFVAALADRPARLTLRGSYSLAGFSADADLLLWLHGPLLEDVQTLAAALRRTALGAHLQLAFAFTGAATPAQYDPAHSAAFVQGLPPKRYLSVYPFIKTPEWYLLPFEDRRALMAEHGRIGRRFSVPRPQPAPAAGADGGAAVATAPPESSVGGGVLTNTVHSFGLGDQEFVVAFESDDAFEMVRMVEALRATEVRRYTKLDTPIFLGLRKEPAEAVEDLG